MYVPLYTTPAVIALLELGVSRPGVVVGGSAVAGACAVRGAWMSVEKDEKTVLIRNFWKTHVIRREEIVRLERRQLWMSPAALFPNADTPFVVLRSGRRIPVMVGVGGHRKVDRLLNSLGKGVVPDDRRIEPVEAWRWIRRQFWR